jgi:hypothetical protein
VIAAHHRSPQFLVEIVLRSGVRMRTETLRLKRTEDLQPSEGVSKTERDRERETSKLVPGRAKPIFGQVGQALQLTGPVSAVFIAGAAAPNP